MIYFETHSTDPYYNLAFEEYLLANRTSGNLLLLWQNENTVVVGLNQNTAEEINAEFIRSNHIHVVRRMTGGGAVYHDLGNLNYSFISDAGTLENTSIAHFSKRVCHALRRMGIPAEANGRNDILVNGKKVSGTAQRLYRNRILHHGTLLFSSEPQRIAAALTPDPFKFSSKSTKSVQSRVGNLADYLPASVTLTDFWRQLLSLLCEEACFPCELSQIERNNIKEPGRNEISHTGVELWQLTGIQYFPPR